MDKGSITDVPGVKVGHAQDLDGATGCTVIVFENGAAAGVDVRGGAPGTRETDCLRPENIVEKIHAVFLAGGSCFGLDCAAGIMHYLEEHDIGFETGIARIPIVPGAILFDLNLGNKKARPDSEMGYIACQRASGENHMQGNVGAGAGATVGKVGGLPTMMKGGLGTASWESDGLVVGTMVAVNCLGDVLDPETGRILAGTLTQDFRRFADSVKLLCTAPWSQAGFPTNTTIGVVATNARLTKAMAIRVAVMAHDGYARAIRPAHTLSDGDTVFCVSTGDMAAEVSALGAVAARVTAQAVANGIREAEGLHGIPAHRDIGKTYL